MDPNENWKRQMELAAHVVKASDNGDTIDPDIAGELAELVLALNQWIARGGFLPDAWRESLRRNHG